MANNTTHIAPSELTEEERPFHYHIEDGQFSFDHYDYQLLGKIGDIVEIEDKEIYIASIEGNYVECIGSIENSFPISE